MHFISTTLTCLVISEIYRECWLRNAVIFAYDICVWLYTQKETGKGIILPLDNLSWCFQGAGTSRVSYTKRFSTDIQKENPQFRCQIVSAQSTRDTRGQHGRIYISIGNVLVSAAPSAAAHRTEQTWIWKSDSFMEKWALGRLRMVVQATCPD